MAARPSPHDLPQDARVQWEGRRPRVVLAGLGHAPLFVLEAAARGVLGACELVVCTGEPKHVYSGMVPGWLAGRYDERALLLDVATIVQRSGGVWRAANVVGLCAASHSLALADGSEERFDIWCIAVGSQPSGLELPGVREHSLALKPLGNIRNIRERLDALVDAGRGRVVVVGGGVAGVEIALACLARAATLGARGRLEVP